MLQSLHVKNLALIEEAEVEWKEGLNILTGETGAGKSLLLGSVHLALGGKYSAAMLREGADYGLVELVFYVCDPRQQKKLERLEIVPEDGIVALSRKLMDGRSISRINGEMVPIGRLKEAAEILIDIHGQHEHQSLLYKKKHLEILDAYAKDEAESVKKQVREAYQIYREAVRVLEEADKGETERKKEEDFLSFEAEEIREAALILGEDEELESRYKKMRNARKIMESLEEAYECTGGFPRRQRPHPWPSHPRHVRSVILRSEDGKSSMENYWRSKVFLEISTGNCPIARMTFLFPRRNSTKRKIGSIRSTI